MYSVLPQARGLRHQYRVGTGRVTLRYVSPYPPPNRTGGFHRIRLSPFGQSPGTFPKRPFPFPQHTPCIPGGQLACALSTFVPVFPKAGGLRHQSSSWCARLSRTPTTMPPLTSQAGIGFSYGSRLPTSTILTILPGISRVPIVGLKRDAVGGVCTWCPFRSLRLPRLFTG